MADHNIEELFARVNALEVKCAEMSTDLCWIKKVMTLLVVISLSAVGVGVPQYFI